MAMGVGFKKLKVWQQSMNLAIEIYRVRNQGQFKRDFSLRDQARRSAVSIPSNIAEGDERDTDRDSVRFFYIAKGSLAELRTQMEIAHQVGYILRGEYESLEEQAIGIGKMLGALIKARSKSL